MDNKQRYYSQTDIHRIYQLTSARQTLLNAEARKEIPKAHRIKQGNNKQVRKWDIKQLPVIGARFGFLKPPKETKVISIFQAKGGVLKSSLSYSFSRILALHGIRTLIVGLDIQGSITELALNPLSKASESLDDLPEYLGLYDYLSGKTDLKSIIKETPLPTLDIIPETPALAPLEKLLRDKKRREYILLDKVIEPLKKESEYDVILFDNSPSWNMLIENSLTASNVLISPVGCDVGSYQALPINFETTLEFKDEMDLKWDDLILVPTLLENTKISKQIYGSYLTQYDEYITSSSIRRAVNCLLYTSPSPRDS